VIASIEEPELIERILAHRRERGEEEALMASLGARAPPQAALFQFNRSASSCCSAQAAVGAARGERRTQASAAPMRRAVFREADSVSR
jgi:hypothetical protein